MDCDNLRTASLYINNQLLSRGLLPDGRNIDFANQGNDAAGGSAATMGQIIGLVNDLLLRRDRDAELRESLSCALRVVRADSIRQTSDLERLAQRHLDEQRKLALSQASEAAVRTQLKAAEATVRGLKDDVVRGRALVGQTRTACATDSRRRDLQIEGLKKQLTEAGRARGTVRSPGVTVINVAGEASPDVAKNCGSASATTDVGAAEYDLRSETNAFLAELARSLSEENDQILQIFRGAMGRLQSMSGWEGGVRVAGDGYAQVTRPSCEDMTADLDAILDHLHLILTNPSFVPIEEVIAREAEIDRLRHGWLKMENRWKEAVHLMDGWRRRMAASGRPVNEEELMMGLRLSPVRVRDVDETAQGFGLELPTLHEESEPEGEHGFVRPSLRKLPVRRVSRMSLPSTTVVAANGLRHVNEDLVDQEQQMSKIWYGLDEWKEEEKKQDGPDVDDPNVRILQQSIALVEPLPVRDATGKRNGLSSRKIRDITVDIKYHDDEDVGDDEDDENDEEDKACAEAEEHDVWNLMLDDVVNQIDQDQENRPIRFEPATDKTRPSLKIKTPRPKPCSRLPLSRLPPRQPQQSPLTTAAIAAKLAASEREADVARVRAKLKAAHAAALAPLAPSPKTSAVPEQPEPTAVLPEPVPTRKRDRRVDKLARRRSTLRPWELESLMLGSAATIAAVQ